jgi:hypothetical protein
VTALDDLKAGLADVLPEPVARLELVSAASVKVEPVEWLWDRRLPLRAVSLMAGMEGYGKTAFSLWLAAKVTRGALPGDRHGQPCDVIVVSVEDDRSSVLVPRLLAADADLERVLFVDLPLGVPFTVDHVDRLAEAMAERDVGLIIIDPLDSHLGATVDSHRKSDVQIAIGMLAVLAQQANCSVLGIAHLSKGQASDVLNRVIGSRGFTSTARSLLAVGEHPEDPDERLCALRKANQCDWRAVPAVRFVVESAKVPHPDEGRPALDTAAVRITGELEGFDANRILQVPDADERNALEAAAEWLADVLADGPKPSAEVKRMAKAADIAERTLQRARKKVNATIQAADATQGSPTTWSL